MIMFIEYNGDNQYFMEPPVGQKGLRRCGNYFEYCEGNCNSCTKNNFYATDHTVLDQTLVLKINDQVNRM